MTWPERGVYFFFEPGEALSNSRVGPRVVRVGTHALTARSRTTLWKRLSQHRGTVTPKGGNHRGSIFRLLIGAALLARGGTSDCASWGNGSSANTAIRISERAIEARVSDYVGGMPFLSLAIDDPSGTDACRGYIERNSIALLSNFAKPAIDSPSPHWLGSRCPHDRVQCSGLWNQNHVEESYDQSFLDWPSPGCWSSIALSPARSEIVVRTWRVARQLMGDIQGYASCGSLLTKAPASRKFEPSAPLRCVS